ncbi:magnesium transporter [Crassaminicella thermophila]|uniref:Magnesium transporter MgtE n=1 Tax=Crassaminicella thermophila TaxID=2599308 RepID=A0A5C0SCI4_CRATE|nr:magnesium transporter [Crassaminicella thermophila]QEK11436.1 magnesium transporter [Crassaminicella thermophila]
MKERVIELMNEKKYTKVREEVIELNAIDIAELLEELDTNNALILFRMLPKDVSAEVFANLSNENQKYIINAITDKEIQFIMDELFFDDMIDFLEEMPASVVKKIIKNTKEDERRLINQFLNYPANSAGSLMTIEYVGLKKEMTVKQAMEYIKRIGIDKETIYTCYVMDVNRKLEGIVSLRKLVVSDDDKTIEEIMDTGVIYVNTHDDQEEIAHVFKKYNFIALPVVDKEERLIGIITIDDIVDVIEEENTEDFHKMAAMEPSEEEYLETSVITLARKRIVWLMALMISAIFTGSIISKFESVLQSVVALAAFMPMLMGTGGNAGAQSATLIIRGMALDEIELSDIFKVIWKELRVSSLVGVLLSLVNFIRLYFFQHVDIRIAMVVCSTLIVVVILAKIVGGTLPIIAKTLKLDPAIMASPMITTIVDAVSLFVYFTMASRILGIA